MREASLKGTGLLKPSLPSDARVFTDLSVKVSSGRLKALIHVLFQPYGLGEPSEPDLKRIAQQHCSKAEQAQSSGYNLSVPNTACYIPNG